MLNMKLCNRHWKIAKNFLLDFILKILILFRLLIRILDICDHKLYTRTFYLSMVPFTEECSFILLSLTHASV